MELNKKRYIAAVSGGPDSMALLHKYNKLIVGVCHVNYHKRKDSDVDAQLVMDYCSNHHIALVIHDVDKKIYQNKKIHNFQNFAREVRYTFFAQCAKQFKCSNLLVAHNLNDFLETAVMQQNRKSQNFFYGIKETSTYLNLMIYRPLIKEFKADLERYCKKNEIAYAIDSTNNLDIYERNRIRKQLSKLSKSQLLALYKKFQARNKKQAKIEKKVNALLKAWTKTNHSVAFFRKIDAQFVNPLIYVYLKNNKIITVNYNKIKLVRDFIVSKKSNNSLRLEDGVKLCKKNKHIYLRRKYG